MGHILKSTLAALALSINLATMAIAGPFEDGYAAYLRGDYQTALRLWKPLAEQGDANAQTGLGVMYGEGRGVPKDDAEAVRWYRKAAEQGHPYAMYSLGVMFEKGVGGLLQDYVLAHMWLNLAAAKGVENAAEIRDSVASLMTPVQIAEAQRLAREWQPK